MRTSLFSILFFASISFQVCKAAETTAPVAGDSKSLHGAPAQNSENTTPIEKADALLALMCGGKENAAHFDCDKIKPVVDKFKKDVKVALANSKSDYSKLSLAIQNLMNSQEGVKQTVTGNACSEKDGGLDLWARNANDILKELSTSTELKNTNIKELAKAEQLNTSQLFLTPDTAKEKERIIREAVRKNRITLYGKMLHLSDNLTEKFIKTFSGEIASAKDGRNEGKHTETHAKEAGRILAIHLDSMSAKQKEELARFANSFPKSSVDKDFKQAIQLAMNNWSKDIKDAKSNESPDGCLADVSTDVPFGYLKQGFLDAMNKDGVVGKNRDDFWSTVDKANNGDATATADLKKKWGNNLPAFIQSLKDMAVNAPTDADKQSAKESLAKIVAAIGDPKQSMENPNQEGGRINTYEIAMQDGSGKPAKIEASQTMDSNSGGGLQEVSVGDNNTDMRNFTMTETKPAEVAQGRVAPVSTTEQKPVADNNPAVGEQSGGLWLTGLATTGLIAAALNPTVQQTIRDLYNNLMGDRKPAEMKEETQVQAETAAPNTEKPTTIPRNKKTTAATIRFEQIPLIPVPVPKPLNTKLEAAPITIPRRTPSLPNTLKKPEVGEPSREKDVDDSTRAGSRDEVEGLKDIDEPPRA